MFKDLEFEPVSSAIVEAGDTTSPLAQYADYTWKRAEDLECLHQPDGSVALYSEGIEPGDIAVGFCPDGNFLSAVSGLAEVPERIQELFLQTEANE